MNVNGYPIQPEAPKVIDNEQVHVYVPNATSEKPGISMFDNEHFDVDNDGKVRIDPSLISKINQAYDTADENSEKIGSGDIINPDIEGSETGLIRLANHTYRQLELFKESSDAAHDDLSNSINDNKEELNEHQQEIEDVKQSVSDIESDIGDAELRTENKTLVGAINENNSLIDDIKIEIGQATLNTVDKTVKGAVNEVQQLAKDVQNQSDTNRLNIANVTAQVQGIARTYSISTFLDFISFMRGETSLSVLEDTNGDGAKETRWIHITDLKTNDNIIIVEHGVPDVWFSSDYDEDKVETVTYRDTKYPLVAVDSENNILGLMHVSETDYTVIEGHATSAQLSASNAKKSEDAARASELEAEKYSAEVRQIADDFDNTVESTLNEIENAKDEVEKIFGQLTIVNEPGDRKDAVMDQESVTRIVRQTNNSAWFNMQDKIMRIILGSGGHVTMLYLTPETRMPWLIDSSGSDSFTDVLTESLVKYDFTDYIKCGRYLYIDIEKIPNDDGRVVIYFYKKVDNEYVLRWDIIKRNTVSGVRNYLNRTYTGAPILIPDDNCYIRVCKVKGDTKIYSWDGKPCGVSLSAGIDYMGTDGSMMVSTNTTKKRFTTVVPSNTRLLLTDDTLRMLTIAGIRESLGQNNMTEIINKDSYNSVFDLSDYDYDSYMVSLEYWVKDSGLLLYNELDQHLICITDDMCHERVVGDSRKYLDNALKINSLEWTPKREMLLRRIRTTELEYREGITYRGLPYGGRWDNTHFIGVNVSPRTFLNAVNDKNSIIYHERTKTSYDDPLTKEVPYYAPWYGSVCSSYTSLICGFPSPNTNAGFIYDPDIVNNFYDNAPLGIIWSDKGHCVVPVDKYHGKDMSVIRVAESLKPLSSITNRYTNVELEKNAFSHYNGKTYFGDMFYTARHLRQNGNLKNLPYATFDDTTVLNGYARPYKGDRCVFTSKEQIRINLQDDCGDTLFIQSKDTGNYIAISIADKLVTDYYRDPDTGEIVKDKNTGQPIKSGQHVIVNDSLEDGIYYVYTSRTSISDEFPENEIESFEYVNITNDPVVMIADDGKSITFNAGEFWYAVCEVGKNPLLDRGKELACVEYRKNEDYSRWFENGQVIENCWAIFYKAQYGAYSIILGDYLDD